MFVRRVCAGLWETGNEGSISPHPTRDGFRRCRSCRTQKVSNLNLPSQMVAAPPPTPPLCGDFQRRIIAVKEMMAQLQPWIEQEKAKHIQCAVRLAKRGFERIEKLWDETEVADSKAESLAAATLDKHDAIIRRNLGMNETSAGSCSLNLHVLTGGRAIISPQRSIDQSGGVAPEKTIYQDHPAH